MNAVSKSEILKQARTLIGTKYNDLDCSHFVHKAYELAGLKYPYQNTATFHLLTNYFMEVEEAEPGDVILYSGHMGLHDPEGCNTMNTKECQKLKGDARILSARSGNNLGVEYGRSAWFGTVQKIYRWKDGIAPAAPSALSVK